MCVTALECDPGTMVRCTNTSFPLESKQEGDERAAGREREGMHKCATEHEDEPEWRNE